LKKDFEPQKASSPGENVAPPEELATARLSVPPPEQGAQPVEASSSARIQIPDESWSDSQIDFAYCVHAYLRDSIKFADQKAAFILAIASALLAFLVKQGAQKSLLTPLGLRHFSEWSAFFACLLTGLAGLLSLLVVLPRLGKKTGGPIYWGGILELGGLAAYKATFQGLDKNGIVMAVLDHCYDLAEIANRKFELLKWATWFGAGAAIAATCVLLGL
jgi:hypothetical protein